MTLLISIFVKKYVIMFAWHKIISQNFALNLPKINNEQNQTATQQYLADRKVKQSKNKIFIIKQIKLFVYMDRNYVLVNPSEAIT